MSVQHTPGPWELSYDQGSYRDIMTKDARVCTVRQSYVSREAYAANARLIAAPPDLLAALSALANYFEVHTADTGRTFRGEEVWQAARAAIAKATHET